ncbi:MAG: hypothetical protein WDN30_12245 [Pararobbsia sp.]
MNNDADSEDERTRQAARRARLRRDRWLRAAVWPLVALAALCAIALGRAVRGVPDRERHALCVAGGGRTARRPPLRHARRRRARDRCALHEPALA